jgi:hypothetical protein
MNCLSVAIVLHLASLHSPSGFDNANYGAGLECRITKEIGAEVGVYRNSYGQGSAYVAGEYRHTFANNWAVGAAIGIATNYPEGTIPIGGLTLHTPTVNGWGGRALFGPKARAHGAHVLHFMITKEL